MIDARNRAILTLNNSTNRRTAEIIEQLAELTDLIVKMEWDLATYSARSLSNSCLNQAHETNQLADLREGASE